MIFCKIEKMLNMKNILLLTVCLLALQFSLQAQNPEHKAMRKRVEAQRVAFMTQKMDLSPDESAAFWPLYNAYKKEQQKLRIQIEAYHEKDGQLTEQEANTLLAQIIDSEYKQIEIRKTYIEKFKEVLPSRKILMIAPLERAFNREILKKLRG
jgi:hypothetical protein